MIKIFLLIGLLSPFFNCYSSTIEGKGEEGEELKRPIIIANKRAGEILSEIQFTEIKVSETSSEVHLSGPNIEGVPFVPRSSECKDLACREKVVSLNLKELCKDLKFSDVDEEKTKLKVVSSSNIPFYYTRDEGGRAWLKVRIGSYLLRTVDFKVIDQLVCF